MSKQIILAVFAIFSIFTVKADDNKPVVSVAFTPDGKYIITQGTIKGANPYNGVQLWDSKTAKRVKSIQSDSLIFAIAVSPDSKFLLFSQDNKVFLYSLPDCNKIKEFVDEKAKKRTCDVVFTPDGKNFIVATADGYAKMWNIETSTIIKKFKIKGEQGQLAISHNGKYLVTSDTYDKYVKLWDIESGDELKKFELETDDKTDGANSIAFSSNDKFFATAGRAVPALFNVAGRSVVRNYNDFQESSNVIMFSKKDEYLFIGGYKQMFRTTTDRMSRHTPWFEQDNYIWDAALSPNQDFMITACFDGTAQLRDANTGRYIYSFYHFDKEYAPGDWLPYARITDDPIPATWESNITDIDVKYLQADRKYSQGKYAEAIKMYEDYLKSANGNMHENFMPYGNLGICYYMEKDYDNALKCMKKDLEFDETRSLYNVSAVYAVKGDTVNALTWLEKSQSSANPYSRTAILKDKDWAFLLTNDAFKSIMAQDKRTPFKKRCDSADYYLNEKADLKMAETMMNEAAKLDPKNVKALHGQGIIASRYGSVQAAYWFFRDEAEVESFVEYNGVKTYLGYQQMGQMWVEMKNAGAAAHYTQIAIAGNKTFYLGYMDLAANYLGASQYQDALKVMLDYIRIAPEDEFGQYMTGLAYYYAGNRDLARTYAQKAIDMSKAAGGTPPKEYEFLLTRE